MDDLTVSRVSLISLRKIYVYGVLHVRSATSLARLGKILKVKIKEKKETKILEYGTQNYNSKDYID